MIYEGKEITLTARDIREGVAISLDTQYVLTELLSLGEVTKFQDRAEIVPNILSSLQTCA